MPRQDTRVLAGGDDEPLERQYDRAAAEVRIERGVRRLGAAGDERDAAGAHAREPRDLAPCVFDDAARGPALGVDRRGVAPVVSIAASAAARASARNGAVAL